MSPTTQTLLALLPAVVSGLALGWYLSRVEDRVFSGREQALGMLYVVIAACLLGLWVRYWAPWYETAMTWRTFVTAVLAAIGAMIVALIVEIVVDGLVRAAAAHRRSPGL